LIKLEDGNQFQTVSRISDIVKRIAPGYPVSYYFLDEEIERYYEEERRLSSLINTAMVLSLIISCIGLFGLAAFTTRKRQKEIGLRKVNGATPASLVILLTREFCALILVASILALPAGYYIISRWLESYAYHISIKPVYFIVTIIIVVSVAIGTVAFNTLRAAGLNPVNTLREE